MTTGQVGQNPRRTGAGRPFALPGDGAAIEAHGVRAAYGDRVALEELSFSVPRGEVLGVLGPNGAGKTTAIRVLTTVLEPCDGEFAVVGVSCDHPREIRRRIGVLPESAGYPEHQTGAEFLCYHARLHGLDRGTARTLARRLLAEFGLADRGTP